MIKSTNSVYHNQWLLLLVLLVLYANLKVGFPLALALAAMLACTALSFYISLSYFKLPKKEKKKICTGYRWINKHPYTTTIILAISTLTLLFVHRIGA